MSYRPKEGWDAKQIVRQTLIHHWMAQDKEDTLTLTAIPPFYCALVEAGADAILEALKAEGAIKCEGDVVVLAKREMLQNINRRGWLVFIPEEEK